MAVGRSSDITNMTKAGINFVFNEALKAPQVIEYDQICTKYMEEKPIGTYLSAGDVGNAVDLDEGNVIVYEGIAEAYKTEITTGTKAKGVKATRKQMLDDQTNTVKNLFGAKLVRAMIETKEQHVADKYNDAFATTGADGVYIIHDAHPLVNSAAVNDNLITGDISTDTLKTGITQFAFIKNQAGKRFPTKATHILVHPSEQFNVIEIMNSQLMAQELTNTTNSIAKVAPIGMIFNNYLDTKARGNTYTPWFLLDKTMSDAGCILQYRGGMKLDTEEDFDTKDWKGTCIEEYTAAFVSPGYGIVGSLGT